VVEAGLLALMKGASNRPLCSIEASRHHIAGVDERKMLICALEVTVEKSVKNFDEAHADQAYPPLQIVAHRHESNGPLVYSSAGSTAATERVNIAASPASLIAWQAPAERPMLTLRSSRRDTRRRFVRFRLPISRCMFRRLARAMRAAYPLPYDRARDYGLVSRAHLRGARHCGRKPRPVS
jgi:hypothetical protein